MIYYLLYELIYGRFKEQDWYLVKALNVFQYVTFRTGVCLSHCNVDCAAE